MNLCSKNKQKKDLAIIIAGINANDLRPKFRGLRPQASGVGCANCANEKSKSRNAIKENATAFHLREK